MPETSARESTVAAGPTVAGRPRPSARDRPAGRHARARRSPHPGRSRSTRSWRLVSRWRSKDSAAAPARRSSAIGTSARAAVHHRDDVLGQRAEHGGQQLLDDPLGLDAAPAGRTRWPSAPSRRGLRAARARRAGRGAWRRAAGAGRRRRAPRGPRPGRRPGPGRRPCRQGPCRRGAARRVEASVHGPATWILSGPTYPSASSSRTSRSSRRKDAGPTLVPAGGSRRPASPTGCTSACRSTSRPSAAAGEVGAGAPRRQLRQVRAGRAARRGRAVRPRGHRCRAWSRRPWRDPSAGSRSRVEPAVRSTVADPTTRVPVVEDDGLPGGDAVQRRLEAHVQPIALEHRRWRGRRAPCARTCAVQRMRHRPGRSASHGR